MNIIAFEHSPSTVLGGSERSYFDVLTGLVRKGHRVALYYNVEGNMVQQYAAAGVQTEKTHISFMMRSGSRLCDFWSMIRFAWASRPFEGQSVVYLNFTEALPIAALLKLIRGYRLVCHVRIGYGGLTRQILWAGRLAESFIVINKKFKSAFESVFGKHGSVHVIYNGLTIPPILPPIVTKPSSSSLRLLYLGRIAPEKGVVEMVRAFAMVRAKGIDAILQITGDYVASHFGDYRRELAEAIVKPRVSEWITISPPVANPIEYIGDFDLFIFPSVWEEPFGRTVPESILAGTPVLARNVGMISELMVDNPHFIFATDEELVEKIAQFANRRLIFDFERARKRIEKDFNKERMIDEVENVLVTTIGRTKLNTPNRIK